MQFNSTLNMYFTTLPQITSQTRKESTSTMKEVRREVSEPPLVSSYQALLQNNDMIYSSHTKENDIVVQEIDLPLIDLCNLQSDNGERRRLSAQEIVNAATEWGFFQVLNHGISLEILEKIKRDQVKLFRLPFEKKVGSGILNGSYRWGNPTAMSPNQFSWSEAFHVPLEKLISAEDCNYGEFTSLRELMEKLGMAIMNLGRTLADVLAQNLDHTCHDFTQNCNEGTCFLRLNRYPPCPFSSGAAASGLVSHTDSDYLTILYQDQVGGLQVMKDSRWVAVKPNSNALIVNIGDLFQAWSNDVYKSVEHRVVTNAKRERYSIAYFVCPSYNSAIGAYVQAPRTRYRSFTFGEYRKQVEDDVKKIGRKVGLTRFLL